MKKGRANRSEVSVAPPQTSPEPVQEVDILPPDTLTVKIQSLRLMDEDPKVFTIKVTFYDQLILTGIIKSIAARATQDDNTTLMGTMNYDPSDYEKMSLMADYPLCVHIQPIRSIDSNLSAFETVQSSPGTYSQGNSVRNNKPDSFIRNIEEISCCNIDILSMFMGKNKKQVRKRMEPFIQPSLLHCKSWDNLPIISMELTMSRRLDNHAHHIILKKANYMKITLVGSYNMPLSYDDEYVYTAASKMPSQNETNEGLVTFNSGFRVPKRFDSMNFSPKWESLRVGDDNFTKGDAKFECTVKEIQNDANIPLERYMHKINLTTVWGSFHRTLLMGKSNDRLWKFIRKYHWPLEVHIYGERGGYSFMAFLNLFKLLYPGEDRVRLAVPLQWINAEAMQRMCGSELLLTPNEKASSTPVSKGANKSDSMTTVNNDNEPIVRPTGCDENNAFVIIEVRLLHPLKKKAIPAHIPNTDIHDMLKAMEQAEPQKRKCSGRGQLARDWQSTVRSAASSLRKVPYHGMTEFCKFNRQLSESRTRVEISTSFWQDAAVYVNNNFVVDDFLRSDNAFEEMLMLAHSCLMISACAALVGVDNWNIANKTLKAARHARQMQDIFHATDLYMEVVIHKPHDGNDWRELGTCLKDVNKEWANVCINKAVMLDPRHPLTILSKGSMAFEEDPALAEPFFVALLALCPFWSTAWVIANAYYLEREFFHLADQVWQYNKKTHQEGMSEELNFPRAWDYELGDWWDYTPILPGTSPYYGAADLLLRLRAVALAEVCISRALCESGESAVYFHLVALCCRLRGNYTDALCHLQTAIKRFGEISYLRTLEAECYHKQQDIAASMAIFEKTSGSTGAFSILLSLPSRDQQRSRTILVELVRRQPSAYAWMALADDWISRAGVGESGDRAPTEEQIAAKTCAIACAQQALKWDRRMGRAWSMLSKLVKTSARRLHCREMAESCGYFSMSEERMESRLQSKQSLCHYLGISERGCRCKLNEYIQL